MDIMEAMKNRHSVRQYQDRTIEKETLEELKRYIAECNAESGLHIQFIENEPKAFNAHYGAFSGVTDYIALVGKKSSDLEEKCGYFGEKIVLKAQMLGLNTCWVALTYKKIPGVFTIRDGEKLTVVIAVGYGMTQGVSHKMKTISQVSNAGSDTPDWFVKGIEAALLAPTAMNQQKFRLTYKDGKVSAKAGMGFYAKMDLGIVKCHFEIGAGTENIEWI